jgi:hypothetical protein
MPRKKSSTLNWEKLSIVHGKAVSIHAHRLKIPNGWIFTQSYTYKDQVSSTSCFIPDDNHQWAPEYVPIPSKDNSLKNLLLKYKAGTLTDDEKIDLEALIKANS